MKFKFLFTFLLFTLLFSFASATTLSEYPSKTVGEEFSFCQVCSDATYITLSNIDTPNSTQNINTNMTSTGGGSFCYNYTPTQVGNYDFAGVSDGCLRTFAVAVPITPNGRLYDTGDSLIFIFVSIFFIAMMMGFNLIAKAINYERWYEKIKKRYITRNFVKWSLSAIVYNIMENSLIVYFLLGLPILLTLMDLVFLYNITSITLYMQAIFYIYLSMIAVLGVVFLSHIQEWFMDAIEELQEIDWGVGQDD